MHQYWLSQMEMMGLQYTLDVCGTGLEAVLMKRGKLLLVQVMLNVY